VIREYRAEDLQDVLAAWAAANAVAHPFLSREFLAKVRHDIANTYLPNTETWVWETEDRVVGFISMMGNEIGGLFIEPAFHRAGIGHALVDHVRETRDQLEVEVFKDNAIGRAFYAGYGFVLMQESVHDETGLDVMRLVLKGSASSASE